MLAANLGYMKFTATVLLALLLGFTACQTVNENWEADSADPERLHRSMRQLTDVIVHDIFSPPVASRIYAYSNLAAYEALRPGYPGYKTLEGQLNQLKDIPQPEANLEYCYPLASTVAFLKTGTHLIFSEDKMDAFRNELLQEFREVNMPEAVFERSVAYGEAVAAHIIQYSDSDNYKQSRTFPKYSLTNNPAHWKPTPPDYMDGIEPHWMTIRTFVLDSAQQFKPKPPTPFNMEDKDGQFFKETMEVYTALDEDREEKLAIAEFWDCNPYVTHHKGHVMFATKKITPGGHWMNIADIAAHKTKADIMRSADAYVWTALSLADAFISCWDEKYRSVMVRPETVINEFIDPEWLPALQTPPFPEYTSGHSVISRAAAVALTHLYGDNFAFDDTSEEEYGLPVRSFQSFLEASDEAALSRLYGGIHYMPACTEGVIQGEAVGDYITGKLVTRSDRISMK